MAAPAIAKIIVPGRFIAQNNQRAFSSVERTLQPGIRATIQFHRRNCIENYNVEYVAAHQLLSRPEYVIFAQIANDPKRSIFLLSIEQA